VQISSPDFKRERANTLRKSLAGYVIPIDGIEESLERSQGLYSSQKTFEE